MTVKVESEGRVLLAELFYCGGEDGDDPNHGNSLAWRNDWRLWPPVAGKQTRQIEIAKGIFIPGRRLRFGLGETIYLHQRFLRQENRG